MNGIFDKDGLPITMERWAELHNDRNYVIVKQEPLDEGHRISTVWLGLNHGWGGTLQIFETMIFGHGDYVDLECRRYATLREAEEGHEALKREWKQKMVEQFKKALEAEGD